MKFRTTVGGREFEIEVDHDRLVWIDGQPLYVDLEQVGGLPLFELQLGDKAHLLFVDGDHGQWQVEVRGQILPVQVEPGRPMLVPRPAERVDDNSVVRVVAPLAGRLLALPAAAGERVEAGQVVAVVESMKCRWKSRPPGPAPCWPCMDRWAATWRWAQSW